MALCSSHTLAALVAELRERAVAGEPQESLIGWLASLVTGLDITIRTDICTAPHFFLSWGPEKSRSAGSCGQKKKSTARLSPQTHTVSSGLAITM